MNARLAVAVCVGAGLIGSISPPAAAQADVHARAIARASCQSGKHTDAVVDAKAAMERDQDQLGPRMRMADALVDQGCYQEAVEVLEAAEEAFPHSAELSGKLRDVRSLVTEQTYIEGLTQAAESAKVARNQFRCTKLGDIAACEDALHAKPDDVTLLTAKGDALMQANRPTDAATAYRHASQLKPTDDTVKTKLANAESLVAKTQPAPAAPTPTATVAANTLAPKAPKAARKPAPTVAAATKPVSKLGPNAAATKPPASLATPSVAALAPQDAQTFSNEAPPGQTN
jgi:Flp pilus assembly protein TadD